MLDDISTSTVKINKNNGSVKKIMLVKLLEEVHSFKSCWLRKINSKLVEN